VLVVGDLLVDVLVAVDGPLAHASDTEARIRWGGGGAAANVAAWLAAAGAPVRLCARVGDDAPGREQAAALAAQGVELALAVDPERPTGTCVVLVEPGGERTMLPDRGASGALAPEDLPAGLDGVAHVHVSGYALLHPGSRAAGVEALRRAREAGIPTSVDPGSAAPITALGADAFAGLVADVDLLLPNADEAAALGGAAHLAARTGADVVVTRGAAGATFVPSTVGSPSGADGDPTIDVPAVAVPDVADLAGAGDAFAAGLLAARLRGAAPQAQLEAGTALAARAVTGTGARPMTATPGRSLKVQ
jgi:ribokinase